MKNLLPSAKATRGSVSLVALYLSKARQAQDVTRVQGKLIIFGLKEAAPLADGILS